MLYEKETRIYELDGCFGCHSFCSCKLLLLGSRSLLQPMPTKMLPTKAMLQAMLPTKAMLPHAMQSLLPIN